VASYRSRRPIRVVRLIGHADRDPARGNAFERKISEERADTVRQAVLDSMRRAARSSDVAAQIHWQIAGVGASSLAVPRPTTEAERAANRRVEVWLGVAGQAPANRPFVPSPPLIRWIQACTNRLVGSSLGVTGVFDAPTQNAVRSFQQRRGLPVTADISLATLAALAQACAAPPGLYLPAGGRQFSPAAGSFRCAPVPSTVTPATFLPEPTKRPDEASRSALGNLGLNKSQLVAFEKAGGLVAIRAISAEFGSAALEELLRRVRYTPAQLVSPPHDRTPATLHKWGFSSAAPLLAPRLLLAVPGHFRELARRAPSAREAHALESIGWMLMSQLRDQTASATSTARRRGMRWFVPAAPPFVTPVSDPATPGPPSISASVRQLITRRAMNAGATQAQYQRAFELWDQGLPGRAWRLETGIDTSRLGAGQPFYPETVVIPPPPNLIADKNALRGAWRARVNATDRDPATPRGSPASAAALAKGTTPALSNNPISLFTLAYPLATTFPLAESETTLLAASLKCLRGLQPTFSQIFTTITELGWTDLLFETQGLALFRGNTSNRRCLSEHGFGTAIDVNVFENARGSGAIGAMDPRVVAVFEAFGFNWGRCFPTSDPMHFEYRPERSFCVP
jgi:peptidoglycan hydrolase-like protein with peptidoglycan-binding domain